MDIIELLKASASHQVMSVDDFELTLAAIDTPAINDIMARMSEDEIEDAAGFDVVDGVATIKVRGLMVPSLSYDLTAYGLTAYNILSEYIAECSEDDNIKSVVFDIDSSGGFVKGLQRVVDDITALDKPTTTVASGTMASAAYWLGVSADTVTATAMGNSIGSIGVYAIHTEVSKMHEAQGIQTTIFKSGIWKGAYSKYKALSPLEKTRMQAEVDEDASVFFNHVAGNRPKLTAGNVKDLEGASMNAKKALNVGLIDSISGVNENVSENEGQQATMTDFTQADIDAAKVAAKAEAMAEARQEVEAELKAAAAQAKARTTLIMGHENSTDEVVALLDSPAFAAVADEDLTSLLALMPASTVEAALNAQGGADVDAAPVIVDTTPVEGADADAVAKATADAAKAMSALDTSKFL